MFSSLYLFIVIVSQTECNINSSAGFTGKHFDPMNPVDCEIDILDIAHALSLMCRGNGHIKTFYSVAQHSIACAEEAFERGYTSIVMMGCLLHDASEAYLSDVTRPIKKDLPQYLQAEDRLQNAIWRRFIGRDLTADEKEKVFEIDDLMLSMEFHQLMPEELNDDYRKLVKDVVCETMPTEIVRDKFLQLAANGYEDFAIHIATEDELKQFPDACAPDIASSVKKEPLWVLVYEDEIVGCGYYDSSSAVCRFSAEPINFIYPTFLRSAVMTKSKTCNTYDDLCSYEGKAVILTTTENEIFYGFASHLPAEYCLHEFGVEEEAIQIGMYVFYPWDIKGITDWQISKVVI